MRHSTLIASLLFSTLTLLISGCVGQPGPAQPVAINKSLPQVSLNGYLSDTSAIAFEWKPAGDPRVKGIRIYRDTPGSGDKKLYRIATVDGTERTHYVDKGLTPATAYRYRFTTFDAKGRESMPDKTVTAKTLSLPEPVSYVTATKELARSAKLLWRPHPDLRVTGYAIQRLDPDAKSFRQIDTVQGRLSAEYIDHDLDDDSVYRYRILARTFDERSSRPSATVTVATKPLPLPPTQLQASRGKIRTVALQWKPSPNKNIAHYNVYRADSPNGYYDYRTKVVSTSVVDKSDKDGAHYFYKVAAVDHDGLESLMSEVAEGTTLPAPKAPVLTSAVLQDHAVVIRWKATDPRTVSFELHKTTRSGWFDSSESVIRDIKTTTFTDPNIAPGQEYTYEVAAVDADGLTSKLSESKTVLVEGP